MHQRTRPPAPPTTLTAVAQAAARHDLFPDTAGTLEEQLDALQTAYRKLVLLVHPDRNTRDVALATRVLQDVNALRDQREAEIRSRGSPALPGPRAPRRGGSIVRTRPASIVVDDYDDTEPPPLPSCGCVIIARATLPGRVIFCSRPDQEWAVRVSDKRALVIQHAWECTTYRRAHPQTFSEDSVVADHGLFTHYMPGWFWVHARLRQQPVHDYFR